MKIISANIYGFGKWVDYTIDFHRDGFTCIYGENESGKSTLHQFVLFMLFGLPPKQRNFYRPKTSGKLGGRLTLEEPETGMFTIERLDEVNNGAATCYTEDGKTWNETWLQDRLEGLTKQTYQSIFSFSSMDLHLLHHMKEDDLTEVLLGIGMTGSAEIYHVEKRLDQQMGELYKRTGRKPQINQQLTSIDELHTKLQNAKETEETYRELKDSQSSLSKKISVHQQRIRQKRNTLNRIEKQQQALPYIQEYAEAKDKLAAFPEAMHFPEQGITRLERIKDTLLPLKSEQRILQENQHKYEQKINDFQQEVEAFPWSQVTELLEKKHSWELRNKELTQLEENLRKIQAQIENGIDQLDIAINQEGLAALHLPFHTERQWQDLKEGIENIRLEKEKVDQEKEELDRQEQFIKQEKGMLEAEVLPEEEERELKEKITTFQEQSLAIKWQENTAHLRKSKQQKQKRANRMLAGSVLAGFIMGGAGLLFELSALYIFMIASFLIGIFMWQSEKKSMKEMEALLLKGAPEQIKKVAAEEKEEAEQRLSSNENVLLDLRRLEDQLKNLNLQRLKWEEKNNFIDDKYKRLKKQIDEQLGQFPFLAQLEVRYWPEMYHRLKQIVQLIRDKKKLEETMENLTEEYARFQDEVNTHLQQERQLPLETALEMLEEKWEHINNVKKQMEHYKAQLEENLQAQDTLKENLQVYENEMTILFNNAEVATEEEFYQKAKQLAQKDAYVREKQRTKEHLSRILPETERDMLLQNIPEEHHLTEQYLNTKQTVEQIEADLDEKREELAQVQAKLEQLEASDSYSSLMHEMEMKKEELNHLAKKWAVIKTAREMLLETKRNYRDKYLHQIMEKTTEYFAQLTYGSYTKVFAPNKEHSFYAVASDRSRYHVNELSRGTMDQLYVSLRLAISDILSKEYRIPFIIDDGFIHFDSIRTRRMMELLRDISKEQQMIVFTCKKEIVNHVPASQTIQLDKRVKELL